MWGRGLRGAGKVGGYVWEGGRRKVQKCEGMKVLPALPVKCPCNPFRILHHSHHWRLLPAVLPVIVGQSHCQCVTRCAPEQEQKGVLGAFKPWLC